MSLSVTHMRVFLWLSSATLPLFRVVNALKMNRNEAETLPLSHFQPKGPMCLLTSYS